MKLRQLALKRELSNADLVQLGGRCTERHDIITRDRVIRCLDRGLTRRAPCICQLGGGPLRPPNPSLNDILRRGGSRATPSAQRRKTPPHNSTNLMTLLLRGRFEGASRQTYAGTCGPGNSLEFWSASGSDDQFLPVLKRNRTHTLHNSTGTSALATPMTFQLARIETRSRSKQDLPLHSGNAKARVCSGEDFRLTVFGAQQNQLVSPTETCQQAPPRKITEFGGAFPRRLRRRAASWRTLAARSRRSSRRTTAPPCARALRRSGSPGCFPDLSGARLTSPPAAGRLRMRRDPARASIRRRNGRRRDRRSRENPNAVARKISAAHPFRPPDKRVRAANNAGIAA